VKSVKRTDDNCVVVADNQGRQITYDHVIFACHADQSLRILGESATAAERAELKNFRFERNRAILHCDQKVWH
jgi:predicted NAD/FAD-binding protein